MFFVGDERVKQSICLHKQLPARNPRKCATTTGTIKFLDLTLCPPGGAVTRRPERGGRGRVLASERGRPLEDGRLRSGCFRYATSGVCWPPRGETIQSVFGFLSFCFT